MSSANWYFVNSAIAAALLCGATAVSGQAAYKPHSAPPRRIVMRGPVEVPLLVEPGGSSRPVVAVMVNGHGPYRFLIETGAREIDLSPSLIDSLGLKRIGGSADQPEYRVDSIDVGAASFQKIIVSAEPPGIVKLGIAGVLGLPFYQDLLLTIDYAGRRLRLARDSLPAANGADVLALVRVDDFWGMPMSIVGHPLTGVLDTQASGAVSIPPSLAGQLPFIGGLITIGRARGAFGTVDIKRGRLAGNVTIGRYTFPTPFLDAIPLPSDFPSKPNIGTQILDNFVVSLDQRHARLRLSRNGPAEITLPGPGRGRQ